MVIREKISSCKYIDDTTNIKSKIITTGFSLFSIVFAGYLLIGALEHYFFKFVIII